MSKNLDQKILLAHNVIGRVIVLIYQAFPPVYEREARPKDEDIA
jgi:hypothetical protein